MIKISYVAMFKGLIRDSYNAFKAWLVRKTPY